MGNFEKLGILVIIVLVVVIIVVATVGTHDPTRTDVQLSSTRDVVDQQPDSRPDTRQDVRQDARQDAPQDTRQNPAQGSRQDSRPAVDRVLVPRTYTVKKNDALWKIGVSELGSGARWTEIVALNPGLDPDRLKPGTVIKLPPRDPARPAAERSPERTPEVSTGARTYRIKDGDMLWNIARSHLGSGARWPEIVAANPSLNPDRLPIGESIVLPAR